MSSARMSRGETLVLVMQPAQDRPTHDWAVLPHYSDRATRILFCGSTTVQAVWASPGGCVRSEGSNCEV